MSAELMEGEILVAVVHRHWIVAARALALPSALLVLVGLLDVPLRHQVLPHDVKLALTLGVVALAGLWAIAVWVRWSASSLTLTDQRVILVSGIFSRLSKVIGLDRVQDVSTRQGLAGRVLGYGTVEIDAAGPGGAEVLDHLPRPNQVRDLVFRQSEGLRRAHAAEFGTPAAEPARPGFNP